MNLEKKVIINGDDFGYSDGCNEGIIRAYLEGILTTTTVMVNLLEGNESLQGGATRVAKPPLGVGVHLNITNGKPLSNWVENAFTRPFKNQNDPREWQGSAWREYIARFPQEAIIREYQSQIGKAQELFGELDHLDSHHSSTSYFPADEAYFDVSRQFGLPIRPLAPHSESSMYGGDMIVDQSFFVRARQLGIRTVDRVDLRYLNKDTFYEALEKVKPGEVVEFMFHPAIDSSQGEFRKENFDLLTSNETMEKIHELGITVTTYQEAAY